MICDDGDVVRGRGFVAMYSALVEEQIDELLDDLSGIEPFDEKKWRWQISRKLDHLLSLTARLGSLDLNDLRDVLYSGKALFERRNEIVHGRFYAGFDDEIRLSSGSTGVAKRPVTAVELYQLANEFFVCRAELIRPRLFHLRRAIAKFRSQSD